MIVLVAAYLLGLLALGYLARGSSTVEDYFLAGRRFGKTILFFTLVATNFSAFFFLGFAGAAYSKGLIQYSIMAVGTALMPVMFAVIGLRVWRLGRQKGYVTMPELVYGESDSRLLRYLFLIILTAYTLPYLGVQAVGAGYILNSLAGLPVMAGAVTVLFVITVYVLLGGMKGSGWTDMVQGIVMFAAMLLSILYVAGGLGGFTKAGETLMASGGGLTQYPGLDSSLLLIAGFTLLWIFVDPVFPQLFTRFYTADSEKSLWTSIKLYPIVVAVIFACPVLIGVWANGTGLQVEKADQALISMVEAFTPRWVYALVMIGALSALMSTADSQLLVLSTMLSRDLGFKSQVKSSRIIALALFTVTACYLLFGFDPNTGIFNTLVKTTFSGLIVLTPSILALLYYRPAPASLTLSIVLGQAAIILMKIGVLPDFGMVEGVTALAVSALVLLAAEKIQG